MPPLFEALTTGETAALLGLLVGVSFGVFAQQSRFCLRSACIEFWRKRPAAKFSIWLFTFSTALLITQWLIHTGQLNTGSVRQLAATGSMSGAIVGGILFGIGMILARGCASRLLVLSGTGNQRALIAGLIVTVVSQASLRGGLSPAREGISEWWLVDASQRSLAAYLPSWGPIALGVMLFIAAVWLAIRSGQNSEERETRWHQVAAIGVGASVAMGWGLTAWHASWSFDIVPIKSISFTGPSADTLMGLINQPTLPFSFDIGIVAGVFAGAFVASVVSKEFKLQTFTAETGLSRYIFGAVLMGFGGMLAGGCAVGAGVTGGAVMALTSWVALLSMWLAAGATDALIDRPKRPA